MFWPRCIFQPRLHVRAKLYITKPVWAQMGQLGGAWVGFKCKVPFTGQSTGNQLKERDFTFPKCDLLPHWPIVPLLGCGNTLPISFLRRNCDDGKMQKDTCRSGEAAAEVLISKINTSAWKGRGTADCWCIKKTSGWKMSVFVSWNIATAIAQFDFNYFHFFSFYD